VINRCSTTLQDATKANPESAKTAYALLENECRLSGSKSKNCDRLSRLSASHFHPLYLSQVRRGVWDHWKLFSQTPRLSGRVETTLPPQYTYLVFVRSALCPNTEVSVRTYTLPNTEVSKMDAYLFPTPKCQVRVSLPNTDVSVLGRKPFPNTEVSVLSSKDG
jgi:hypothetical protein